MWKSPRRAEESPHGHRYSREDLAALLFPLRPLLDAVERGRPVDVTAEPMLRRMEREELVVALHALFVALLEPEPVPPSGHPGYLEALIAELLDQCHQLVVGELENDDPAAEITAARHAAWTSFTRLCRDHDGQGRLWLPALEDLGLDVDDPDTPKSPLLNESHWEEILREGVAGEFLWDEDWRTDAMLDADPTDAWLAAEETGIDLETTHRLPPTPSAGQYQAARAYLRRLTASD